MPEMYVVIHEDKKYHLVSHQKQHDLGYKPVILSVSLLRPLAYGSMS